MSIVFCWFYQHFCVDFLSSEEYNILIRNGVIQIDTIGNRIKEIRKATGKTQQAFADAIGLKRNTVATYEMGKATPSDRTITDICREFNVDEIWLRTGNGEMFVPMPEDEDFIQTMAEIEVSDDSFIKAILRSYWKLSDDEKAAIHKLVDGMINEKKAGD